MKIFSLLFVISGSVFFLVSAIGVLKFPDVFSRMHAASKSSSLGMGLISTGAILEFASWDVTLKAVLIILFIFLTTPVAAHILGRAGYLAGARPWEKTKVDEMKIVYPDSLKPEYEESQ